MVGNPDGLAPHSRGMPNRPAYAGVDHSKTQRARQPHPEGFEKHRGACPLHQRASPSLILTPGAMATPPGWFMGGRQSLEDGAEA